MLKKNYIRTTAFTHTPFRRRSHPECQRTFSSVFLYWSRGNPTHNCGAASPVLYRLSYTGPLKMETEDQWQTEFLMYTYFDVLHVIVATSTENIYCHSMAECHHYHSQNTNRLLQFYLIKKKADYTGNKVPFRRQSRTKQQEQRNWKRHLGRPDRWQRRQECLSLRTIKSR